MTYWDMNEYEVDDIMTDFLKKSLCQSEFDPILDRYVFNIHDLQLEYLKSLFDNEHPKAEIELHTHFLDQYFKKARFQYGNIQDDSYVFYNLGYHLFKSEQYHLFPQVYLDLHFVEAMLRATSSVDLLNDYKRYGDHIIGTVSICVIFVPLILILEFVLFKTFQQKTLQNFEYTSTYYNDIIYSFGFNFR